jgi:branched-subunit amino acid transport protein
MHAARLMCIAVVGHRSDLTIDRLLNTIEHIALTLLTNNQKTLMIGSLLSYLTLACAMKSG